MKAEYFERPDLTNIRSVVMDGDDLKVLSASVWRSFTYEEVRTLMHDTGTYVLPTEELIAHLDELIGDHSAIEVACGNGYIGRELSIPITDAKIQDRPDIKLLYGMAGQPTINYPKDVEKLTAEEAARKYRPHTVIVCYAPHRSKTGSGCDHGINFSKLLNLCKRLIFVCNEDTHAENPLLRIAHKDYTIDGLITRCMNEPWKNRIKIWERK